MIPKTIAYGWFGHNPKPPLIQHCIDSWAKTNPDYTVTELNEDNCLISRNDWVRQAYEQKKWAYVADYFRIEYMFHHGGITLDADVELVNQLDPYLLDNDFFSGQEINGKILITATMGSVRYNPLLNIILNYYDIMPFIQAPNTKFLTTILSLFVKQTLPDKTILLHGNGILYPQDVFCPYNHPKRTSYMTDQTVAIHHFQGSWKKP